MLAMREEYLMMRLYVLNLPETTIQCPRWITTVMRIYQMPIQSSRRFMNAYDHGLNGRQAAWAMRKYQGHQVLPPDIFEELEKKGVV